jgi:sugar phosphate isomerase/epimerase
MSVDQGFMIGPHHDRAAAFAFAADRGFDFVELNGEHAFRRGRADPERVRSLAVEHDLGLVLHLPYRLDACSPHEHVREGGRRELEAAVDLAAAFGAERAIMHAQTLAHEETWDPAEIRTHVLESARRLHEYGVDAGVEVCVENLKRAFFDAHDFPTLFEHTDAAMCLDTGHAHVVGMGAAEQAAFLRDHGDRIDHVHLNDTRRDDDDEHLPVGLGRVEFGDLAAAMVESDWSGTCTHEVFGFDLAYVETGKRRFDDLLAAAR